MIAVLRVPGVSAGMIAVFRVCGKGDHSYSTAGGGTAPAGRYGLPHTRVPPSTDTAGVQGRRVPCSPALWLLTSTWLISCSRWSYSGYHQVLICQSAFLLVPPLYPLRASRCPFLKHRSDHVSSALNDSTVPVALRRKAELAFCPEDRALSQLAWFLPSLTCRIACL